MEFFLSLGGSANAALTGLRHQARQTFGSKLFNMPSSKIIKTISVAENLHVSADGIQCLKTGEPLVLGKAPRWFEDPTYDTTGRSFILKTQGDWVAPIIEAIYNKSGVAAGAKIAYFGSAGFDAISFQCLAAEEGNVDPRMTFLFQEYGGIVLHQANIKVTNGDGQATFVAWTSAPGMPDLTIGESTASLSFSCSKFIFPTIAAPSSASATGTAGEVRWDANYVYVCVATNTWKRSALSTW